MESRCRLRSVTSSDLMLPATWRSTLGDRAFAVAGPRAWNSLPDAIRRSPSLETFKRSLKSHLFLQRFLPSLSFSVFVWQLWLCTAPSKWLSIIFSTLQIDYFTLHYITSHYITFSYSSGSYPRFAELIERKKEAEGDGEIGTTDRPTQSQNVVNKFHRANLALRTDQSANISFTLSTLSLSPRITDSCSIAALSNLSIYTSLSKHMNVVRTSLCSNTEHIFSLSLAYLHPTSNVNTGWPCSLGDHFIYSTPVQPVSLGCTWKANNSGMTPIQYTLGWHWTGLWATL